MRLSTFDQSPLLPAFSFHGDGKELAAVSELVDRMSRELAPVQRDLVADGRSAQKGRPGLTADQVLRVLVAKQMNGWSYSQLAFHLTDLQ